MNLLIKDILEKYYTAFQEKDWTVFASLLTNDFTYLTDKGISQNKTQFVDFLEEDDFITTEYFISDINTISSENNTVIVSYKIVFKGSYHGEEMQVKATETIVFQKEESTWKIKHCHTSNY